VAHEHDGREPSARDAAQTQEARREALGQVIEALGGSAPRSEECREILTHAAQAIACAGSDPGAAMAALRAMQDELGAAYAAALRSPRLDAAQRASLVELAAFTVGDDGGAFGSLAPPTGRSG
jgi:hypothetical protein